MDFVVEIKNKQAEVDRKFKVFAPSKERAEEWGSRQAKALGLEPEKARIIATEVVAPPPPAEPAPKEAITPKSAENRRRHGWKPS